jgi:hypothetical protein
MLARGMKLRARWPFKWVTPCIQNQLAWSSLSVEWFLWWPLSSHSFFEPLPSTLASTTRLLIVSGPSRILRIAGQAVMKPVTIFTRLGSTSLRRAVPFPSLVSDDHLLLIDRYRSLSQESRTIHSQVDQTEIVYQSLRY